MEDPQLRGVVVPNLGHVVIYTLILASISNILLVQVARDPSFFTWVVSVASAASAIGLLLSYKWLFLLEHVLLLTFALWVANALEFTLGESDVDSKLRQSGFYFAFALLALGAYVARRAADEYG